MEHELTVGIHQLSDTLVQGLRLFAGNNASFAPQQHYVAETPNIHFQGHISLQGMQSVDGETPRASTVGYFGDHLPNQNQDTTPRFPTKPASTAERKGAE
jgi:hypothetical protein